MAPRKNSSEKIKDAIILLKDEKVTQAINILQNLHDKLTEKETGVKKTRKPSEYNNFVKAKFPEAMKHVDNNRDAMKYIGKLWAEKKAKKK